MADLDVTLGKGFAALLAFVFLAGCAVPIRGGNDSAPTIEACTGGRPDLQRLAEANRCFIASESDDPAFAPLPNQRVILSITPYSGEPDRQSVGSLRSSTLHFTPGRKRLPGEPQHVPYGGYWSRTTDALLFLHWTNGFTGVTMCLREMDEGLWGEVANYSDVGPAKRRIVFLRQETCAPPGALPRDGPSGIGS
jgi:hypothetical protein